VGFVSFVTARLRENPVRTASSVAEDFGPCAEAGTQEEQLLAERTRIAQELHDTLLQGFFAVSMRLRATVDLMPPESIEKAKLGDLLQLVDRTLEQGRRAVQGLRLFSRGESLGQALAGVPNDLCLKQSIDFRVVVHGKERELKDGPFEEVYRIGREAILNAYRHSRAKLIEAEIEYRPTELRIAVRDNGCGIDAHDLHRHANGHWGLLGMRERAERIGARLSLLSKVARGTEVELRVPNRVAFEQSVPSR